MAILRQEAAFVDELYSSGIVNDAERQAMQVCVADVVCGGCSAERWGRGCQVARQAVFL